MSGPVERGLRADLRKRGIKPARSTLAAAAILLARRIDSTDRPMDARDLVSAMRELRLTVAQLNQVAGDANDAVTGLAGEAASKLGQ